MMVTWDEMVVSLNKTYEEIYRICIDDSSSWGMKIEA